MAGKGSEIGGHFAEIQTIVGLVNLKERLGVCLDTCHVFDAGYDIVNNLDAVLDEFDKIIGLDRLKAIHLNDSKNPIGSRKDRHAKIGEGCISMEALVQIINHPALRTLPFYLETPNDVPGYAKEIAMLKNAYR
jgi:deoxyribonuclease-4